jgi:hypothetical protein
MTAVRTPIPPAVWRRIARSGHPPALPTGIDPAEPGRGKVRVVGIVGSGRSGSTLLGQVLAADPAFVMLGELRYLWDQGYRDDARCTCGQPFASCPFWSAVDAAAFGRLAPADLAALVQLKWSVYRLRRIPEYLVHGVARDRLTWATWMRRAYEGSLEVSGADAVIDTSKDKLHWLVMLADPAVELDLVHLVRDPRGVAHSWARHKVGPDGAETRIAVQTPWRSSVQWMFDNAVALPFRRRARSVTLVRYEDFVGDPQATVRRIVDAVGAGDRDRPVRADAATVFAARSHIFAANPNAFESSTRPLRLDDDWRRAMRPADRAKVCSICWPAMLRYRYLGRR